MFFLTILTIRLDNPSVFAYSDYQVIVQQYRDIALIKCLYWRQLDLFRWLVRTTSQTLPQSTLMNQLKDLAALSDGQLQERIQGLQNDDLLVANFEQLEQFLQSYMPCMVVD